MQDKKQVTGFAFLRCALYAFASVLFELPVVAIEGMLQIDINNFTATQYIIHWLITIIGWILLGILVIHIGKMTTGFDIWEHKSRLLLWQYAAIVICFVVNIAVKYFAIWRYHSRLDMGIGAYLYKG